MSPHLRTLVMWAPRVLGLSVAAFLGLFALDAFDTRPVTTALPSFAVHLVPALVVGFVAAAGWRYPVLGTIGFGVLAAGYAAAVPHRLDWILVIAGPLALVAILFAADAMSGRAQRPSRKPT